MQAICAQDVPHPTVIVGEKELAELESEDFAGPEVPTRNLFV